MRETEKPAFIRNFIAGILSAFVTLSYSLSYGALIFSGVSLEAHVAHGLQAALMTAWIVSLVVALGSSFSFAVAGPEANATAILALMAAFTTDLLVKRGCETLKLADSAPLFKMGDTSDALYFLERGELSVLCRWMAGSSSACGRLVRGRWWARWVCSPASRVQRTWSHR